MLVAINVTSLASPFAETLFNEFRAHDLSLKD
jgi:hypothetical protein